MDRIQSDLYNKNEFLIDDGYCRCISFVLLLGLKKCLILSLVWKSSIVIASSGLKEWWFGYQRYCGITILFVRRRLILSNVYDDRDDRVAPWFKGVCDKIAG